MGNESMVFDLSSQSQYFMALLPELVLSVWAMLVLLVDVFQYLGHLPLRADQRVDVLDRARILVLGGSRAAGGKKRLAGRIGDQVKVEEALGLVQQI